MFKSESIEFLSLQKVNPYAFGFFELTKNMIQDFEAFKCETYALLKLKQDEKTTGSFLQAQKSDAF